jgi:4'-phosphopantetheinyl transferase EntD
MMLLPSLLAGIPVATHETDLGAARSLPAPADDLAAVAHAVDERRIDYLAGRSCARVALAKIGINDFVLRAGTDRCPMWPAGVVGSITHTGTTAAGFCGVAVASTADVISLGIDAESSRPLADDLVPLVLTPRERDRVLGSRAEARRIAAVYFSAKESVYKALFPLVRQIIDFQDVDLDMDIEAGRFRARARDAAFTAAAAAVEGRVLITSALVLTAAAIRSPGGLA